MADLNFHVKLKRVITASTVESFWMPSKQKKAATQISAKISKALKIRWLRAKGASREELEILKIKKVLR